jgi:hypothetical protein
MRLASEYWQFNQQLFLAGSRPIGVKEPPRPCTSLGPQMQHKHNVQHYSYYGGSSKE